MTDDNLDYYERRAHDEAEAADSSASIEAASAHRLLAIEYDAQARELRNQQTRPKLGIRSN
jgi:hypothetical protein